MFKTNCLSLTLVFALVLGMAGSSSAFAQRSSEQYEKGVQAYAAGEYPDAYIHLKNALQADPAFLPARLLLAKVHFNAGDVAGAAKESEEALALGADLNLILPVYGASLVILERESELFALEKYVDSLTEENRFEWLLLKGQGYLMIGEADAAQKSFEEAASMFPHDVRSNNTLAAAYLQHQMFDEAQQRVDASLKIDPDNVKSLELQAALAFSQGNNELAKQSLGKAFEQAPDDLRVLRGLARAHLLEGNLVEVRRYLDLILEQSPDDPAATLIKAVLEIDQGESDVGDAMLAGLSLKLSELDALVPQSSQEMQFIQASADYLRGSDRSAMALFNNYLSRNPADLAATRMLADLYIRNAQTGRARDLLSGSKEYIVEDMGLSVLLLRLYIEEGSEYNARALLEDLRKRSEDPLLIAVLEAELLRATGKSAQALPLLPEKDYATVSVSYGLLRGALLLDVNNIAEAAAVAAALQAAYPQKVRVHNFAAIAALRARDLDAAQSAVDAALAISADDVEARFNKAMLLKQNGKLDAATGVLNGILAERASHVRSIMLMAAIMYQQGNTDDAIDWSKKVYAYDKTSTLPGEFQLNVYKQSEDWNSALKTVTQLSKNDPLNEQYLIEQAGILMALRDYELAQRPLRSLFALWQDDAVKLQQLAAMQIQTQNNKEARLSLEAARKLAPDDFAIALDLARLSVAEQQFDQATEQLNQLESSEGKQSGISQVRGEIALAQSNLSEARTYFAEAFSLDANNGNAVVRLYELSLKGVGAQEFTQLLESALAENSLPPLAVRLLADSHMLQGNTDSAVRYYELLLGLPQFENDPGVLNNLANLYADTDLDKALATAMKALDAEDENSAAVLDTVGWIMTRQKNYDKALPYLRRAYTINSRDPEIRYHTAVALLGLERTAEAEQELRSALASKAQFAGREEARKLLDSMTP